MTLRRSDGSAASLLLLAVLLLVPAGTARGQDFEIVVPELVRFDTTSSNTGFFGSWVVFLIAGTETITLSQLEQATWAAWIDNPDLTLSASIANEQLYAPMLPGEATGNAESSSSLDNQVMSDLFPGPFKGCCLLQMGISHPVGYVGTATVTGYLRIGGERRDYSFALELGSFGLPSTHTIVWAQRVAPTSRTRLRHGVNEILVSVHDPDDGTLESVQLDVTLQGSMNIGDGYHGHAHPLAAATEVTSFNDSHSHTVPSVGGSAGGISVTIAPALASMVAHGHLVVSGGTVTTADGGHFHAYGPHVDSQSFGAGQLAPFLAASDFAIPTGDFSTQSEPMHSHHFAGGVQTDFQQHGHTTNPQWSSRTVFVFTPPVPQIPAAPLWALALAAGALLAAVTAAHRARS